MGRPMKGMTYGQVCRLLKGFRRATQPLLVLAEEQWMAKRAARGLEPWTDPAYCAAWLAHYRAYTRMDAQNDAGVRHDHEVWLAWDRAHQKRHRKAARSQVAFLNALPGAIIDGTSG